MIETIKKKIQDYFRKETKLNIFLNAVFFILLILLVIPSTRREVLPRIQRLVLFAPSVEAKGDQISLTGKDYTYQFKDFENNSYTFADFKGEVVFINIWATWCPPCIAEMPSIQKLYNDYKDKVKFVFLTQEDGEKVKPFMEKRELTLPAYQMVYRLPTTLQTQSIPATYLISRKGNIVISKVGTANWNSDTVRKTLDKLIAEEKE